MLSNPDNYDEAGRHQFPAPKTPVASPPSAGLLVWGIVGLVIGQAIYQSGQQQALLDSLSRSLFSGGGDGQMLVGAIISLLGLVALLTGVHRLASGVDELVRGRGRGAAPEPQSTPAPPVPSTRDVLPPATSAD